MRHPEAGVFGLTPDRATCPSCNVDPPPAIDEYLDKPLAVRPPKGCMSSQALEAWFVTLARKAADAADEVDVSDFHGEGAIAKHRDNAIKAMRAATDLALRREDEELVRRRARFIRDRQRGASH